MASVRRSSFVSISVNKLDANLLGQSQFNLLAGRLTQLSLAFFDDFDIIHNLGDSDAFLFFEISAAHAGKGDGFVDARFDGFRIGNFDGHADRRYNRHVVLSFLFDFLAVFAVASIASVSTMTVSVMTVSLVTRLANGDHLDIGSPLECDFDGFGRGTFVFLLVRVSADFLRNLFDRFGTNSAGDSVAEFLIDNTLDGQLNVFANSLKSGCADFSLFNYILNRAVMLGVLVAITTITMVTISRGGMMSIRWFRMVNRGRLVGWCRFGSIGWSRFISRSSFGMIVGRCVIMNITMIVSIISTDS